ncbi:MAG: hypothetical protein WDN26_24000 [Chitinophagaceae bacterium]
MLKHLRSSFQISNFFRGTGLLVKTTLLVVVLFLASIDRAFSQRLEPEAIRQINSLMAEKESRTPAQKKMSSQLVYAYKMRGGQRITADVASLQVDVTKDVQGRVKVELEAVVTPKLLNDLKALGCEIILSSEKYNNVLVNIPLDKTEQVAEMDAVKHLTHWVPPINNSRRTTTVIDNTTTANTGQYVKYSPRFEARAEKLRKQFEEAFKQKKFFWTNFFCRLGYIRSRRNT